MFGNLDFISLATENLILPAPCVKGFKYTVVSTCLVSHIKECVVIAVQIACSSLAQTNGCVVIIVKKPRKSLRIPLGEHALDL